MMKITTILKENRGIIFSKFVLQLLFIMFFVEFVKGALLITFLPFYMKNALGASAFLIGWTLAVQYIGDNLLRTPVGWIIDKVGYRLTMLTGVLATLASVIIIATTSSFGWLIVACALLGIGTAPLWPCLMTGATEIAGNQSSGTIMSVVYLAWLAGVGLGPFTITFFMDGQFETAFRILIGIMAAVVIVALFLPGKLAQIGEKRPTIRQRTEPWWNRIRAYIGEVNQSLKGRRLLLPAMFAQTFALGMMTPILTIYATNVLELSQSQFRALLIVGGAVTVGFMIPVGRLVDRFGTRWFLNIGFLFGAVSLYAFGFVRTMPTLYVVVIVLGTAYACIIPAWNALIASVIPPEKRGTVWGFFLTIEGLGTTVAPIISGKMFDTVGPHAPFVTSACILLALLLLQFMITEKKQTVNKQGS